MKKRILIYGVHTVNLGDDLFYKVLLDRYPNDRFIMFAPDIYKKIYAQYDNCRIVSDTSVFVKILSKFSDILHISTSSIAYALLFFIYRINVFLVIGGSLVMEGDSNLCGILSKMEKLRKIRKRLKICVIGTNFGPCKTVGFQNQVKEALKLADDVCFRDRPSYEVFKELPNVRWGNDIVFHMNKTEHKPKKKVLCVNVKSVADWPQLIPYKDQYLLTTAAIVNNFNKWGGKSFISLFL